MHRYYEVLKKLHLFDDISQSDMKYMGECFKTRILSYAKGEFLFTEGENFKNLGIVAVGNVNISRESEDGSRVILEQAEPGTVLDEAINIGRKDYKVNVNAEASTDCDIVAIPFDKLMTVCEKKCPFHLQLVLNIVRLIASNHNALTMKIDYLSKKSIRSKILSFLKFESEKHKSDEFEISFDRKELAEFLFVDRSALSRELSRMQREKLIKFRKNHFKILEKGKALS